MGCKYVLNLNEHCKHIMIIRAKCGHAWTHDQSGSDWHMPYMHGAASVVALLVHARLGLLLNLASLAVATLHTFSLCMVFLQEPVSSNHIAVSRHARSGSIGSYKTATRLPGCRHTKPQMQSLLQEGLQMPAEQLQNTSADKGSTATRT